MKKGLVCMLFAACAACQTRALPPVYAAPPGTVEVTVQVLPPVTPSATPDCLAAAGVTLAVQRLSDTKIVLHAAGLQPGEIPFVFYSTAISGVGGRRGEAWGFAKGADEHGEFSTDLTGLEPLEGQSAAIWDIRLVHRRGVACTVVTLP